MRREQDFYKALFIGDDRFLLNNLICEFLRNEKISIISAPTWDNGIKCMENNELKAVIIDSMLISRLSASAVLPAIKRSKAVFFFINCQPDMWIYEIADKIKGKTIIIYKRPLNIDKFIKAVKKVCKKK